MDLRKWLRPSGAAKQICGLRPLNLVHEAQVFFPKLSQGEAQLFSHANRKGEATSSSPEGTASRLNFRLVLCPNAEI